MKPLKVPPLPTGKTSLSQMLSMLGIENWDVLLVGDGSGSLYGSGKPCGWACISIERASLERRLWYGSVNVGDINFAEMMAYIAPLNHFADTAVKSGSLYDPKNVHIVTDALFVANRAQSLKSGIKKDASVWQVFKQYANSGLNLHWHWARRNEVELNHLADIVSKLARVGTVEEDLLGQVPDICKSFDSVDNILYRANPHDADMPSEV
jgi:hypothetical protein